LIHAAHFPARVISEAARDHNVVAPPHSDTIKDTAAFGKPCHNKNRSS
jgi:hypothetical protein